MKSINPKITIEIFQRIRHSNITDFKSKIKSLKIIKEGLEIQHIMSSVTPKCCYNMPADPTTQLPTSTRPVKLDEPQLNPLTRNTGPLT